MNASQAPTAADQEAAHEREARAYGAAAKALQAYQAAAAEYQEAIEDNIRSRQVW